MTTEQSKPLAKSLHTITVLVRVGRMVMSARQCGPAYAIGMALEILGLAGQPDPHDLADKAVAQLKKQAATAIPQAAE